MSLSQFSSHVTLAFLGAVAYFISGWFAAPYLVDAAKENRRRIERIGPLLSEAHERWRRRSSLDAHWRRKLNRELLSIHRLHGTRPFYPWIVALFFLSMWVLLGAATIDMLVR